MSNRDAFFFTAMWLALPLSQPNEWGWRPEQVGHLLAGEQPDAPPGVSPRSTPHAKRLKGAQDRLEAAARLGVVRDDLAAHLKALGTYFELTFSRQSRLLSPELRQFHEYAILKYVDQIVTSHPEAPEAAQAIRLRGRARLRRTVASASPESTREWIDRAREAYQRRENPDYAFCVDVLECVVDRMEFESSLFARLYLGLAYIGRSRPEEGMRELRLVVARGRARQPVARAHYALAVMLISEQRYTDALGHFEKLVAECPNSRYVRRSKKYIHKLKGASREAPALFEPQSK